MITDDVMESLKKKSYPYKKRVAITRPLALFMSKSQHTIGVSLTLMEEAACSYHEVELVLLPIIFNSHFHVVTLNKEIKVYFHYSSFDNCMYNADAKDMVRINYISRI